ncbi:MAG: PEP-CTERM sorting domain-containing protein [Akkermansia sp.]
MRSAIFLFPGHAEPASPLGLGLGALLLRRRRN